NSHSKRSDTSLHTTSTIEKKRSTDKSPLPPFFKGGINIQNPFLTNIESNNLNLINDEINKSNSFTPFSKWGRGDLFPFSLINRITKKDKTGNQTIQDLFEIFELKKVANDTIRTYSSGQKQRLKYILALLKEPLVCLFDEPFTNLDDNGINIAKQFIDNLIKKKRIVIIASNDDREIELSNRKIELI
ncbi:MAG TPA: ATP-binding cassette domain-containing protein, partial [Candidatus Kapabacteria bacterium]|nr:ATP-binding cassette domain-containing protein [Candidatus Kapabacteria bacterium]